MKRAKETESESEISFTVTSSCMRLGQEDREERSTALVVLYKRGKAHSVIGIGVFISQRLALD